MPIDMQHASLSSLLKFIFTKIIIIKVSSFESSEKIKGKFGPYCAILDDDESSVTLNKLAMNAYLLLVIVWFCSERFPLPLGAWDGLRYFCSTHWAFHVLILV